MGEALQAKIDRELALCLQEWGQFGQKFQVQGVIPTNRSSCQKSR